MPAFRTAPASYHLSRSARGWKVIGPNGRTVARFDGLLAHRQAARYARHVRRLQPT